MKYIRKELLMALVIAACPAFVFADGGGSGISGIHILIAGFIIAAIIDVAHGFRKDQAKLRERQEDYLRRQQNRTPGNRKRIRKK